MLSIPSTGVRRGVGGRWAELARGLLGVAGMDAVMFTHKRYALLAGFAAREIASWVRLTPARVDLLLQLFHRSLSQKELAVRLGVAQSVVSRMVTALEQLGHVSRSRDPYDGRVRIVSIHSTTRALLDGGLECVVFEGLPGNLQSCAEMVALWAWQREIGRLGVSLEPPSQDDQSLLLEDLYFAVRRQKCRERWFEETERPLARCAVAGL